MVEDSRRGTAPRSLVVGLVALMATPAVLFYAILSVLVKNLPLEDDYEALLDFLNRLHDAPTLAAKMSYFVAARSNEYKLFFGRAIGLLQYALFGHVDFRTLCLIGNASVLLLAFVLWKMFLPDKDLSFRLWRFLPVPWLLFQLCYAETLNWAMPGLQNLPVLAFAFGSLYSLFRQRYGWATLCMVLSIASSANAFILLLLGIVALRRRLVPLCIWCAAGVACGAGYAYRYSASLPQEGPHPSVLKLVLHPHPLYALAFAGNAAALPFVFIPHRMVVLMALIFGFLLCAGFFVLRKFFFRYQDAGYSVVFLLLTAVGVSGLRIGLGIAHSLDPRYKIYSVLLLVLLWFAIAEKLSSHRVIMLATCCAMAFSISMDVYGWNLLKRRTDETVDGMRLYETKGIGPLLPRPDRIGLVFERMEALAPRVLQRSAELGIYVPDRY